ncbi:MAG: peptidylprolyl isomerase, partial [Deltaproteobacteria bacterium]|nr:peptidylprolyl isomerase [Deltaproteobacteria bacterium]
MTEKIAANKVVTISYTLRGDDGEIIDSSDEGNALVYLHGASNIVPGLEEELEGAAQGDSIKASIPPEKGYGPRIGESQEVSRNLFPADTELAAGLQVMAHDDQGRELPFFITGLSEETVTVDPNHPLAGETLHFNVTIEALRDATEEEIAHG